MGEIISLEDLGAYNGDCMMGYWGKMILLMRKRRNEKGGA